MFFLLLVALSTFFTVQSESSSWHGHTTFCFSVQATISYTKIYKGTADNHTDLLAIAFVNRGIPFLKEGNEPQECESWSDLECQTDCWQNTVDHAQLDSLLVHHCFYLNHDIGSSEPVKVVFKISRDSHQQLDGREISYVLPENEKYLIFDETRDVYDLCTGLTVVAGGLGKPILVSTSDFAGTLEKLKRRYSG